MAVRGNPILVSGINSILGIVLLAIICMPILSTLFNIFPSLMPETIFIIAIYDFALAIIMYLTYKFYKWLITPAYRSGSTPHIIVSSPGTIIYNNTMVDGKPVTENDTDPMVRETINNAMKQIENLGINQSINIYNSSDEPRIIEKETIREIVKIPCKYCGTLVDVTLTRCPSCGAPFTRW